MLVTMMKNAIANNIDELDFFMDALEQGFTLDDFKETQYYDYAKKFMQEHGLMEEI